MRKRIAWLDQLRGIAMFTVVLGHVALPKNAISLIYSFHMPLFFMISGMTVNDTKLIGVSVVPYIKDKAKKLIIPYFWMSFIMFPMWFITFQKITSTKTTIFQVIQGILYGNNVEYHSGTSNALWFLFALFFADVIYMLIVKISKNDEGKKLLFVIACGIIGYLEKGIAQIWHFNVAFSAVVFLYIGRCIMMLYKEKQEWFENKKAEGKYIILLTLFIIGWFTHKWNGRISVTANKFGNSLLLFYLTAIAFSLLITMIVIMLPKIKLFEYVGKNSLLYVGVHIPIIRFFEKAFPEIFSQTLFCVILAVSVYLAVAVICLIFNRAFPYVCAKPIKDCSKLVEFGKYPLVFICSIIPMLGLFQFLRLFDSEALEKTAILGVTLVFSVVFVIVTNRFTPMIYCQKPKTKQNIAIVD